MNPGIDLKPGSARGMVSSGEQLPGAGRRTIAELVERFNQDPRRGKGHDNVLTQVVVNQMTQQGYRLDTRLRPGTAKLNPGGMAMACTDVIHLENRWLGEQVAQWVGLDIPDVSRPLRQINGLAVLNPGWVAAMARRVFQVILDETKVIQMALNQGKSGDLLVIFPEQVSRTLRLVHEAQSR